MLLFVTDKLDVVVNENNWKLLLFVTDKLVVVNVNNWKLLLYVTDKLDVVVNVNNWKLYLWLRVPFFSRRRVYDYHRSQQLG